MISLLTHVKSRWTIPLSNSVSMLTNTLFLWKTNSVDTNRLIISTGCFLKLFDHSKSVSQYLTGLALFPVGRMSGSSVSTMWPEESQVVIG